LLVAFVVSLFFGDSENKMRSHSLLQLKVQSYFWLILPEESNSGFPVVKPAYEAAIAQTDPTGAARYS
jgi:hypothetical protein